MSDEKKSTGDRLLGGILGAVKLDWIRPLIWKIGGRKLLVTGGALAVIDRIVAAGGANLAWPHAIACLAVAAASIGMAFSTASEDKAKKKEAA